MKSENEPKTVLGWSYFIRILSRKKQVLFQIILALIIALILQLCLPFLTQSIIDVGINTKNEKFLFIILVGQFTLIFSKIIVEFIRNRITMGISMELNFLMLSDFWSKITKLSASRFDKTSFGDLFQRMADNTRIQSFLTGPAIFTAFSTLNLIIYSIVLVIYNPLIFLTFVLGSTLYFTWIVMFLKIRRKLNERSFELSAKSNNATLQMLMGMQDTKLYNAERSMRQRWHSIQFLQFKFYLKNLNITTIQQSGGILINQGKDLFITYLSATLVINGQLTLGGMLAIQFITGQLSGPIESFISFIQGAQDSNISMKRLNDVYTLEEESTDTKMISNYSTDMPIFISNLSFSYGEKTNTIKILDDISFTIEPGQTTAIVGISGSGKTTILKLLLKMNSEYSGSIKIGDIDLKHISPKSWREQCSAVLQDSFIFEDTIISNISLGADNVDYLRVIKCCRVVNILDYIESLPNKFETKIGGYTSGLSQGQKQRILIARALYKESKFLFLDESTSALDSINENSILRSINEFNNNKTVIIVSHRLKTIVSADKIIVIANNKIAETGTHRQLMDTKGVYFSLFSDQCSIS